MNYQNMLPSQQVLYISVRLRSSFWSYVLGEQAKRPKAANKSKRYADTLCLPKSKFPLSVKDGLASKREVEIQKTAGFDKLYAWQAEQKREKVFTLHDGPPYANGKVHVGHAVNKILKDITIRYKLLRGYKVNYRPGWDCHGMPIEVKAITKATSAGHKQDLTPVQIRDIARSFAAEAVAGQLKSFKRWGVMGDWDSHYSTLSADYQSVQLDVFFSIYEKGLIYRDYMPVFWSPSSRTALAEAELEYNPTHKSTAVYVKFPLTHVQQSVQQLAGQGSRMSAIVWTTTPWTIPFNRAVCFNSNVTYALVRDKEKGETYLCEEGFAASLNKILGHETDVIGKVPGETLEGTRYSNAITNEEMKFVSASHVTAGKGTGLVHTAPAHGHEDFQAARRHNLSLECGVDEGGGFMAGSVDSRLQGKMADPEGDQAVIELLGSLVLKKEDYVHSYPYDWRTKQPVIIRASKQWFINTDAIKDKALACLRDVRIIPPQAEQGMVQQLQSRPYWCISRQRYWGLPMPVFYRKDNHQPLVTRETVEHVKEVFGRHGADSWWTLPISELLPGPLLAKLGKGVPEDYVRGQDILDIWFDSGVSWAAVLKDVGSQADLYLEGMDQFGGWFQTSLLTSTAVHGRAPYRTLMVHGFATDESGRKMSKSVGNVVDPDTVVNGGKNRQQEPAYGVEVLRWWVAHSHTHTNIMIGPNILAQFADALFKVRKTMRYLLGNVSDFDMKMNGVPYESLLPQDQYMLHLLYKFRQQAEGFYEEFSYNKVILALEKFTNTSLSSFYINITRDRCYCSGRDSVERRSCQTVQHHLLQVLSVTAAPILPHLMEEVYAHLPPHSKNTDTLFQGAWPQLDPRWHSPDLQQRVEPIFAIRDSIVEALGSASPSEFGVIIYASPMLDKYLSELQEEKTSCLSPLCEILGTSHTSVLAVPPPVIPEDCMFVSGSVDLSVPDKSGKMVTITDDYKLMIVVSEAFLCERCRRYTSQSSTSPCDRCLDVLGQAWAS